MLGACAALVSVVALNYNLIMLALALASLTSQMAWIGLVFSAWPMAGGSKFINAFV